MFATAIDALAETFPAIERCGGERFFERSQEPIWTRTNRHRRSRRTRHDLRDVLGHVSTGSENPYLGDVARIEYARVEAHHAADADPIPIAILRIFRRNSSDTRSESSPITYACPIPVSRWVPLAASTDLDPMSILHRPKTFDPAHLNVEPLFANRRGL